MAKRQHHVLKEGYSGWKFSYFSGYRTQEELFIKLLKTISHTRSYLLNIERAVEAFLQQTSIPEEKIRELREKYGK